MSVAYGGGLLAASALLFAFACGQYRRSYPSAWTKIDSLTTVLTLSILGLATFGLAFLVVGLANLGEKTNWMADIAVVGGGLVLCWIFVPRLMAPARLSEQPTPDAGLPEPANDPHPRTPSRSGGSFGKSGRRRAA